MAEQDKQAEGVPSYLDMSDDEIAKMDISALDTSTQGTEEKQETAEKEPVVDAEAATDAVDVDDDQEDAGDSANEQEIKDPKATPAGEPAVDGEKEPAAQTETVDYKAAYEKLFTPFKANGKEIAVENVDDAISLMQMGANYNKKMAALKPNLKLLKLLENNGLLSEERISFLIDLEKKSPEAISKLVKDSGMDPMDLDADKASEYKPKTYTVDDREMELDTVLDEIQGTPTYNRTLDIVSTKWDGPSKQVIAGSPQLLKVINDHIASGIYDAISKEVERERMFGRLNGLSDIEAYRQIGDAMHKRGGFGQPASQPVPPKPVVVVPKPSKVDEDKLREKRRAAGSTKPAVSNMIPKEFNPLAMSDEEFSKQVNSKYL